MVIDSGQAEQAATVFYSYRPKPSGTVSNCILQLPPRATRTNF
ncbi:hypothetical protein [Methanimicrococcus hongohii]|nr:hypothetical protein [Methanimicrococcus sp. Hf6]